MNPVSRALVFLTSVVGFFVIPSLLLAWLLAFKLEDPAFYIKAVDYSNIVRNFIEENVHNSTSVPEALKRNISLAKDGVDEQIRNQIQPQIQSLLRQTKNWLASRGNLPVYALELTLFKKHTSDVMKEALKQQKFTDRVFVNSCLAYVAGLPNVIVLDKALQKDRMAEAVKPYKKLIGQVLRWKKLVPFIPFVFLLLFMLFTLNFRYSFHSFSNLLAFSGLFFLLVFFLLLIASSAAFPVVASHLLKYLRPYNPGLPELSFIQLIKFFISTVAFQGILASLAMTAVGVVFFTRRRVRKIRSQDQTAKPSSVL